MSVTSFIASNIYKDAVRSSLSVRDMVEIYNKDPFLFYKITPSSWSPVPPGILGKYEELRKGMSELSVCDGSITEEPLEFLTKPQSELGY